MTTHSGCESSEMKLSKIALILATFLALAVVGCSSNKVDDELKTEKQLYDEAFAALNRALYETAITKYQTLQRVYPYGEYSVQGQLEIAYAHYKHKQPEQALAAIESFIDLNPDNSNIAYAHYLKGLIHLPIQTPKFLQMVFVTQEQFSDHEIEAAHDAYTAFEEVVQRYPFSVYADSARQNMIDLINVFARHDVKIARFYLNRKAYVGAINRAKTVLETYVNSPYTEEALAILVYAYDKLDLEELKNDSRLVLSHNFPDSRFLESETAVLGQ